MLQITKISLKNICGLLKKENFYKKKRVILTKQEFDIKRRGLKKSSKRISNRHKTFYLRKNDH